MSLTIISGVTMLSAITMSTVSSTVGDISTTMELLLFAVDHLMSFVQVTSIFGSCAFVVALFAHVTFFGALGKKIYRRHLAKKTRLSTALKSNHEN
jgi:uncharacterized PurR-regulated membrane protein YhhQ (DUF165 family)